MEPYPAALRYVPTSCRPWAMTTLIRPAYDAMAAGEMAVLKKSYYKTEGTISYSYPR